MLKNTLIIALIILAIYLYYQQQKPNLLTGNNSDTSDTIRDLQTQLQQASQLETYNTQQLTQYESQVNRLQEQVKTFQGEGDWETKTTQTITELEAEVQDLTQEKSSLQEQLNSILNKWNWGSWKPTSATEFLNKLEPWINQHLESAEKLKVAEKQLVDSKREIERLKTERETNEEMENLESERDEVIREKKEMEQELLSYNKRLQLKSQEADNKAQEIERLKKDCLVYKDKYSKQGVLLDGEQTENNKLTEQNEKLQAKLKELESAQTKLPGSWDYEEDLETKLEELEQQNLGLVNDKKVLAKQIKDLEEELEEQKKKKTVEQPPLFSRQRKKK